MAKIAKQTRTSVGSSRRSSHPRKKVVLNITESEVIRAQQRSKVRTRRKDLKQPGELENAFNEIKLGFLAADQRHRASIDELVMKCFRIAYFLKSSVTGPNRNTNEDWKTYWIRKGRNGNVALKYVYKKAHSDPKKASFYYRATNTFFEQGLKAEEIPSRVNSANGYQKLADGNVRSPRPKELTRADKSNHVNDGRIAEKRRTLTKTKTPSPQSLKESDRGSGSDVADNVSVQVTLGENASTFLSLPQPCYATLYVYVSEAEHGGRAIRIEEAWESYRSANHGAIYH